MGRLWKNYQKRKNCFHHTLGSLEEGPESFIVSTLIDFGRRKLFYCNACGKIWIY